eukprot:CAMPEP_0194200178 /NCGR_PEP_ID=MMETSP0156-20130528/895_1 /TAXON_ID=33649 /ORGANISM="Thalassionema nitzschioides, Strain L26-B" /LENGTH=929 /DNA_ID=CAMNT_0038925145 /DNA_START=54 /DNA_END=2843 /DNA_ORIENTATION=+
MRSLFASFVLLLNLHVAVGDRKLPASNLLRSRVAVGESCADYPSSIEIETSLSLNLFNHDLKGEEFRKYARGYATIYNRNINLCDVIRGRISDSARDTNGKDDDSSSPSGTETDTIKAYTYYFGVKFVCCSTEECRADAESSNDNSDAMITCALPSYDFASLFSDESDLALETHTTRTLELQYHSLSDCNYCNAKKAYCFLSDYYIPDWHIRNGSFYQCRCKEGYQGDGWRCHDVNECIGGDWPCPSIEDGGFCVDKDPNDQEFPRYKCGCRSGFESWLDGEHGARICIPEGTASIYIDDPSTQPSSTPVPTVSQVPSPPPSITGGCNLCPSQSLCVETSPWAPDAFESDQDDGKWIRCKCQEGYSGDGFRCTDVNECLLENPPCPSKEEGGYCVDRDPNDSQFPLYECGCLAGFEMTSSNEHGATRCGFLSASPTLSVSPTASPAPSVAASQKPTSSLAPSTSSLPTELQLTEYLDTVFINVNGTTAEDIFAQRELIEEAFLLAYQALDTNECNCRFLSNVTILGILSDSGFLSATDDFDSTTVTRMMQEVSDVSNSTNSTDSGTSFFVFDFSIWFRYLFSCFNCQSTFLLNDAFRRQLVESFTVDTKTFTASLNERLSEKPEVTSVEKVVSTNQAPPLDLEEYLPKTSAPTAAPIPCETECTGDFQVCEGTVCKCEDGYFQPSGVGGACFDDNECKSGDHSCNIKTEICVNLVGTFRCDCLDGFEKKDGVCIDIDECVIDPNLCSTGDVCVNKIGGLPGYDCVLLTPAPTTPKPSPSPTSKPPDELVHCIAVIDEDDNFGNPDQFDTWELFRADYPYRRFCLLIVESTGSTVNPPANFLSDTRAISVAVRRDNGNDPLKEDWFTLCNVKSNQHTVALWIDNSGSMYTSNVASSKALFESKLLDKGILLNLQVSNAENWIDPFIASFA